MRALGDASFSRSTPLPAAGQECISSQIDIGQLTADVINEQFDVKITLPGITLPEGETITIRFEDSADGTTFAPIIELSALSITTTDVEHVLRLPNATRQFIRLHMVSTSGVGTISGSAKFQLFF